MKRINQKALRTSVAWLGAGSCVAIPAYTFFRDYTPPLFPQVGLILTALSGAMFYALARTHKGDKMTAAALRRLIRWSMLFIGVAVICMVVYAVLLNYWTVLDPRRGAARYQIGFGTALWSLSNNGRRLVSQYPGFTPQELMLADSAFVPGGPERIWTTSSMVLAGIALIILYLLAFGCWTTGFALLQKHRMAR